MKKAISFLIAVLLVMTAFAVYATGQKESSAAADSGKVTIVVNCNEQGKVDPSLGTTADNFFTEWINENSPVNIEWKPIPVNDMEERINVLFAAGEAPDLIMHPWQGKFENWASQGLLMPIDDLIKNHSTNYKEFWANDTTIQKMGRVNDATYIFINKKLFEPHQMLIIRQDWLDALGLDAPTTTDEFFEVAKAFTFDDPDGNGKDDTYGYDLAFIGEMAMWAMFQAPDNNDFLLEGNKVVHTYEHKKDSVAFMKKLYDAGVVSPDFLTDKGAADAEQRMLTGKLGMMAFPRWKVNRTRMETFLTNVPDGEIVPIPLPESKYGTFTAHIGFPYATNLGIDAKSEYPEEIMAYIDWTMEPDVQKVLLRGFEGEQYTFNEAGIPKDIMTDQAQKERDALTQAWYARGGFYHYILPEIWWADEYRLDLTDPIDKYAFDLREAAWGKYNTKERPFFQPWIGGPVLDDELSVISASVNQPLKDMWRRAIVSGDDYTVEEAHKDAAELWDKSGGEKIEVFMQDWFDNSRDSIILTRDLYE